MNDCESLYKDQIDELIYQLQEEYKKAVSYIKHWRNLIRDNKARYSDAMDVSHVEMAAWYQAQLTKCYQGLQHCQVQRRLFVQCLREHGLLHLIDEVI